MLPTTSISTCRVKVVSVWTSEVSRAISTPARSLSKKGMESRWRCSYAAIRRRPRNRSPARAEHTTTSRSKSGRKSTSPR